MCFTLQNHSIGLFVLNPLPYTHLLSVRFDLLIYLNSCNIRFILKFLHNFLVTFFYSDYA